MKQIRKTIVVALLVAVSAGTSMAQFERSTAAIRTLINRIQTDTASLRASVQYSANRRNYRHNDLNQLITNFEAATVALERNLGSRRNTTSEARTVLDRATPINDFFANNRMDSRAERAWLTLRNDLNQLSSSYNLNWQWSSTSPNGSAGSTLTNAQLRQLVQHIDTKTTAFSRQLRQDLIRRNDRSWLDQVRQRLTSFESAVVQVRTRTFNQQISSGDVGTLLQNASLLNSSISDRGVSYSARNSWNQLRPDLETLAGAFNVSWNWSTYPGNGNYPSSRDLTGTYRIASNQIDDVQRSIDDATRSLAITERERVRDSLLRRLDPPQMLAIDRRGNEVTIASTRAPQISFVADGRERVETNQNGSTLRVRAQLIGDELSISRTGERANDFNVSFALVDGGRRLLVTRTLYSDRISQAITVRTNYDRTSDVAQLNIYDTNREYPGRAGGEVVGSFVVPNGTELVAVLNDRLNTENSQPNQRFTMTVRSPGAYEGATIEGYVSSVNRSGRITGRSEMTLDFDTIRLRDGRSYRFAGILESVREPDGDVVKVDNEGAVRDSDQTNKTITRTAIGSAVGAIIGAIAGGGKGAAIGAAVGAGAGAGSVYVQGRNDLDLSSGTEMTVRATGPRG